MSDKLQFVVVWRSEPAAQTGDKLKFVEHWVRLLEKART